MADRPTKETRLIVRTTEAQLEAIRAAAEARGLSVAAWTRMVLLDAAKRQTAKA
jgi:predicted DNA binding CopG/RHH family protein